MQTTPCTVDMPPAGCDAGKKLRATRKSRFINRLAALSSEQKIGIIDFFSAHPNYENKIDWNNK